MYGTFPLLPSPPPPPLLNDDVRLNLSHFVQESHHFLIKLNLLHSCRVNVWESTTTTTTGTTLVQTGSKLSWYSPEKKRSGFPFSYSSFAIQMFKFRQCSKKSTHWKFRFENHFSWEKRGKASIFKVVSFLVRLRGALPFQFTLSLVECSSLFLRKTQCESLWNSFYLQKKLIEKREKKKVLCKHHFSI